MPGVFFGEVDEPADATPDFQATIEAALARAAAPEGAPAAAGATIPTLEPATPMSAPTGTSATPGMPADASTSEPAATAQPPAYSLSEIRNWDFASQATPGVAARIRSLAWVEDGLRNADEFNAAERLVNIGIGAPDVLADLLDSQFQVDAPAALEMPALLALQRMAQDRPDRLAQLNGAEWFRDGWTDAEAATAAILYERSRFRSPEFDDIVENPSVVNVELSAATNRRGETVPIAVIRSGPRPPGSPILATAQSAVPILEEMFDAPFPASAVVLHVTDYVAGVAAGTNYQTHITLLPRIDANEQPDFSRHAVYHEIAHYFLYAKPIWYAEGGADFAASYALRTTAGDPIETTNQPCAEASSLSDLEVRSPQDVGEAQAQPALWLCNYYLGERLLLSLYRQLGEEQFLARMARTVRSARNRPHLPFAARLHPGRHTDRLAARGRHGSPTGPWNTSGTSGIGGAQVVTLPAFPTPTRRIRRCRRSTVESIRPILH